MVLSDELNAPDQRFALAIARALQGSLDLEALLFEADHLTSRKAFAELISLYRTWLSHTSSPAAYAVWFNFGVVLADSGDTQEAETAYRTSSGLRPDFIPTRLNLGTLLERMGRVEEALACWSDILGLNEAILSASPDHHVQALNNLGRVLEIHKRFDEAEAMLAQSLALSIDQPDARQHWVHLRQKQCKWPINAGPLAMSDDRFQRSGSALSTLSLFDDPALQLEAAKRFMRSKVKQGETPLAPISGYGHKKLRIGYLSSDFCLHPVSLLTVELFEKHDRTRFEIYGFCSSPDDGSPLRARVIKAFDQFIRIKSLSDEEAAALILQHEIDILIDLQGLTSGVRPNIFSFRPAPVQITWLGFPGTSGHSEIDYVIADDFVIPPGSEAFFSEKPLRLPLCFQPSDNQRAVGIMPNRLACGLPADGFVFCCFNNNYKITPELFETWMRILSRTPGSVLWLLADTVWAQQNFIKEAERLGIASERLIFAGRVAPPDYLARYQLADLFLDTYPFNAGTTANDSLWMGLPVLTVSGRSFVSRMAGSLLSALGLPDYIARSLDDYEEKAVALAHSPERISNAKRQLYQARDFSPLYDMTLFARRLEAAYQSAITERYGVKKTILNLDPSGHSVVARLPLFQGHEWNVVEPLSEGSHASLPEPPLLLSIATGSIEAIIASHNLPRYFSHEVAEILSQYHHLLTDDGFVIAVCSDLKAVSAVIIRDGLFGKIYDSSAGPITAQDLVFGHQESLKNGIVSMAHRTGFTLESLIAAFEQSGFASVRGLTRAEHYDVWVIASKKRLSDAEFAVLAQEIFIK